MKYAWKRFWCPREGKMNLSDGGFLYDPESKYASWVQSDVVPFEKISSRPCLALLGEPGIGKSTVVQELITALEEGIEASGDQFLYVNLNEYGDENRLIQALFHSPKFTTWKTGSHVLHLFLDSLDECRIHIPHVGTILVNRLQQVRDRLKSLRLRIACRTADWPAVLDQNLPVLWSDGNFGAYELAPLRRKDVSAAATAEEINAGRFVDALEKAEVVPLAIRPVTLRFLLSIFKDSGALPATRTGLYQRGCELLCEEQNPLRQDLRGVGGAGTLSARERLNVASRIAAVSMFCQKPIICVGSIGNIRCMDEMHISEIASHVSAGLADTPAVLEEHVRETLGTGLFSSRGSERMGFAHQTYAEFLASRYLEWAQVSSQKKLALLRHAGDLEARIVPQLHQTGAWVAGGDKTVSGRIVADDPQVLLCCDEAALGSEQRSRLVAGLLEALDTGRTNDRDWSLHRSYGKLKHPELAGQLRPWLTDRNKDSTARYMAIDIAEACEVRELQGTLADIALDNSEEGRLRGNAAHALASIGDKDTRSRLRPLAFGEAGEDPYDDLKGNALRALWPDVITADELFANLTSPKRSYYFGAYSTFAEYEICEHLDIGGLPVALGWLKAHAAERDSLWPFSRLADEVVLLAWKYMDVADVLSGLADTTIELMSHHHDLIADKDEKDENSALFEDVSRRRRLTQAMIGQGIAKHVVFQLLTDRSSPRIVRADDLEWCVEQLLGSVSQPAESGWAILVCDLFNWAEPSGTAYDLIYHARTRSPELERESRSLFTPIELGSQEAQLLRERYEESLKWQQKKEPQLLEWLPRDRIQHWLNRFEDGQQDAWWMLLRAMTLEDTSKSYEHLFEPDVTGLPGWRNSDESTRARILDAGLVYLTSRNSFDEAELLDGCAAEKDIAPFKAFVLLLKERPHDLSSLVDEVWAHWTSALFGPFGHDGGGDVQRLLISIAYQKVPEQVADTLVRAIRRQISKQDSYFPVLDLISGIWDQRIADVVRGLLDDAQAKPRYWGRILGVLLAHGDSSARLLAQAKLSLPLPQIANKRDLAMSAALSLVKSGDDAAWSLVWPVLQEQREFGRAFIVAVAYNLHHHYEEFFSRLTEDQMADLFVWLAELFPYSINTDDDVGDDDDHVRNGEDDVRHLRTAVINALEKSGTPASYEALRRVASELPEMGWLKSVLVEAKKNTLESTWQPLGPAEFLQITSKADSVLIRDATELQEILVDALQGLQGVLQGETFAAPDLWDQQGKEKFHPKDENHFSDWIKRNLDSELRKRGIVVAREVETRRGEKTDIHVTALVPGLAKDTFEQVRVIIEAKGCWHPELKTAMETQLVERYLKDTACQHGIYLVGWYDCDQWDNRPKRRPKWSLQDAQESLDAQAHDLSSGVLRIRAVVLNAALRSRGAGTVSGTSSQ